MGANPILGLAGSMFSTFLNNRMAQENATISYNRQKDLMDIQNNMNMTNAKNAPGVQSFGLRQAGFNPAMVQGAGTQAAPTVTQGNADMPQTIPFNAQDALLFAQMDNIKAQTEKIKAETEVIPTEGDKNTAQTILFGKQTELTEEQKHKINEEAQKIANENKNYSDENEQLRILGQTVAKEWMKSDWYDRLPDHLKGYVENMANGQTEMTIGSLAAFDRLLNTQGNLSEKQKATLENTVLAEIAKKQLQNDEVLTTIANLPIEEYRYKSNLASKTFEEVTEVQQKIRKIIVEIGRIGIQNQLDEHQMDKLETEINHINKLIEQINENDFGILLKNGRYDKTAALATIQNLAAIIHTLGMFTPGGFISKLKGILSKKGNVSPKDLNKAGKALGEGNKGPTVNKEPNYKNMKDMEDATKQWLNGQSYNHIQSVANFRFT